jgi:predicted ATPase
MITEQKHKIHKNKADSGAAVRSLGDGGNPGLCTLLADVAGHLGHTDDGLHALAEAHSLMEQHEERWWEAEVHRLRGALLLRQPGTPQAEVEACFQRALDMARRQQAKSLELRAAMSLSRLWQQQGKQAEARALLAPIYGWFTEGFDPPTSRRPRRCWRSSHSDTSGHTLASRPSWMCMFRTS